MHESNNAGAHTITLNNIIKLIESLSECEHEYICDRLEKEYQQMIPLGVEIEECENTDGWDDQTQQLKTSNFQYITLDFGFFTAEGVGDRDNEGGWLIPEVEIKLKL